MRQAAHLQRACFYRPRRAAAGPRHGLENVKSPVQTGRRRAGQSVPAQFTASVCQDFLWIRKKISRSWRTCWAIPASRRRAFILWNPAQSTRNCSSACTCCCKNKSMVLLPAGLDGRAENGFSGYIKQKISIVWYHSRCEKASVPVRFRHFTQKMTRKNWQEKRVWFFLPGFCALIFNSPKKSV